MIELVGYAGSALVAVSLMMSNIWRLRWINLVGAAFFVAYGLAVHAYPVALVNALIVAVDAYYLGLLSGKKDYFSLMPAASVDESLLKGFVEYHQEDIQRFFPGFALRGIAEPRCVFTLRNARYLYSTQAGLFKEQGFTEFRVQPGSPEFEGYVKKLGFTPVPGEPGTYAKPV